MRAMFPSLSPASVALAPDSLAEIKAKFLADWQALALDSARGELPPLTDRRFRDPAWQESPASLALAHAYLLICRTMEEMVGALDLPEAQRRRADFALMQWLQALAPSNFLLTNPQAQRAMLESGGASFYRGLGALMHDMAQGRLTQSDESAFELGRNLALTPGAVVFENRFMQLIQYRPATTQVHARPLLMVPPCINKYYILDLQADNSLVRHVVDAGFTVFMISWRNPLPGDTDEIERASWADYLEEGVLRAIDVVCGISGQEQINALGFCVGGTMLANALALAHARGGRPVAALTLLTTFLDFQETGVLDVFVDELQVQAWELKLAQGGLMKASELACTFSFLRPRELVWHYVVHNYLQGESPPPLDFLFWNADGTNLPGPFFAWYLRNTYLENALREPGRLKIAGKPIDLGRLDMPAYIYASHDDHIVPWTSAYASTRLLSGPLRFVLGASGHIAGVVNPPSAGRRHYWTGSDDTQLPAEAQSWLDHANRHAGSWWPDWLEWLADQSGPRKRARRSLGNKEYPPLEDAPGRYVRVRA